MAKKNLIIISKIIFFYSLFYMVMKLIAILFQNAWAVPNLILAFPFFIFAVIGGIMIKKDSYSWVYVVTGVLIISIIRYYESRWILLLHEYFN